VVCERMKPTYQCLLTKKLKNVFLLIYRVRRVAAANNGSDCTVTRSATAQTIVTNWRGRSVPNSHHHQDQHDTRVVCLLLWAHCDEQMVQTVQTVLLLPVAGTVLVRRYINASDFRLLTHRVDPILLLYFIKFLVTMQLDSSGCKS